MRRSVQPVAYVRALQNGQDGLLLLLSGGSRDLPERLFADSHGDRCALPLITGQQSFLQDSCLGFANQFPQQRLEAKLIVFPRIHRLPNRSSVPAVGPEPRPSGSGGAHPNHADRCLCSRSPTPDAALSSAVLSLVNNRVVH